MEDVNLKFETISKEQEKQYYSLKERIDKIGLSAIRDEDEVIDKKVIDAVEDIKESQDDLNDIVMDLTNRFVKLESQVSDQYNQKKEKAEELSCINTIGGDNVHQHKQGQLNEIMIEIEDVQNRVKKQLREVSNEVFDTKRKMDGFVKKNELDEILDAVLIEKGCQFNNKNDNKILDTNSIGTSLEKYYNKEFQIIEKRFVTVNQN